MNEGMSSAHALRDGIQHKLDELEKLPAALLREAFSRSLVKLSLPEL
jgi:hypothetical protein